MRKRNVSTAWKRFVSFPLVVFVAAMLSSTGAFAQQPAGETGAWQFGVSIYGWFPDIAGQTAFTKPGSSNDFEISIENILDNLEFTLMGMFDARKGRWGFLIDGIYMDVGNSKTGTRQASIGGIPLPITSTADVNLDLESWIWTAAGYFRAVDQPGGTLDLLVGGRYLDVEQAVNWDITGSVGSIPPADLSGSASASMTNWDAIIGVRGRFAFGAKKAWFVPYYLDMGTGESDFTWQGIAGLGYAFRWIDIVAAWRYLYYDMPSGKAIKDINFSGPAIGVTFRW